MGGLLQRERIWLLVGMLGLLLAALGGWQVDRVNDRRLGAELEHVAAAVARETQSRVGLYEYGLRGARGALVAGGAAAVRRDTFVAYSQSRELSREFPGARGFGWIRRWPGGGEAGHLLRARADGMPSFAVRQLQPHQGEPFVIEYIYPQAANQGATGLDIASEPVRRQAAVAAARDNAVRLTAPITLVQADKKVRQGFLILLPVYRPGAAHHDADSRWAATLGWTYAPIVADEVLQPVADRFPRIHLSLRETGDTAFFFSTRRAEAGGPADAAAAPPLRVDTEVFGRNWQLQVEATPALRQQTQLAPPWGVLALGTLLSLMLAFMVRLVLARGGPDEAAAVTDRRLVTFLRSPLARWALAVMLVLGLVYAAAAWWQVRDELLARLERDLQATADQRSAAATTAMNGRLSALGYLRGTPPVDGLARADATGRDPRDGSARSMWQARMGQIFAAYGEANPDVQVLRIVRLAGDPVAMVVWQREGGGGTVRLDQALSQTWLTGTRDQQERWRRGQAWIHPIEVLPVPGEGPAHEPLRQRVRSSLPVLQGERVFALLEVEVDVSARFAAQALQLPGGATLHVLDAAQRWITRQGPLEGPAQDSWQDRYTAAAPAATTPLRKLRTWQGPSGMVLGAESIALPNNDDASGRLTYRVLVPQALLQEQTLQAWQARLWPPALAAALLYLIVFFHWRLQQGHQTRLAALNASLAQRVDEQTRSLEQERGRLSNILQGTGAGTWEWNRQTHRIEISARWAEILGYAPEDLAPMDDQRWASLTHPEDLAPTRALLQAHFRGQTSQFACESRLRHRAGHWVWTLASGRIISRTAQDKVEWFSGTLLDITEMRAAQAERERFGSLLRGLLQAATDFSIIATGPEGLITVFNTGAERLLGYAAEEMVGLQTTKVLHLREEVAQRADELSLAEGRRIERSRAIVHRPERDGTEQREWIYVRKDGSHVPVSLSVSAVRSEGGSIIGYLGIAQDISVRRAAERAMLEAKTKAEEASASKSMFLANMSHEIRTPMNAVIGIAHLLADTPLDDDQRQLLSKLQIAGRSLLGVIDDVLDLAKIEAGELSVQPVPYQPAELLQELEAVFGHQARAKGLGWAMERSLQVPATLMGDPHRLKQVLGNLLSNAIKFTQQGVVSLQLDRVELAADGTQPLRFRVRDSGIGIAPEAQAQLFQPFMQAEASTTRRFGGTGLGLSIVKRLVELMGGEVQLRSEPGQGSEFAVLLPLLVCESIAATPAGGLEAVIVEDEPMQRERLAALCAGYGWRTQVLDTGEALLALMQRRHELGLALPDLLLVDWRLGAGLDGVATLRQLRASLPPPRAPSALLITQDQRDALDLEDIGQLVDVVLAKPANPSSLFNAANEALARRHGASPLRGLADTGGGGTKALLPGARLLVVDDSDINLEVARRMLQKQGAQVHCESRAEQALAWLQGGAEVDAVLMDIQMPGMDGLEATRRLRRLPGRAALPVVALTAGALVEERRRALDAGMDDFLTKPLDPQTLARTVRRHIEARRGAPLEQRQEDVPRPAPPQPLRAGLPQIDGVAVDEAVERMGGDVELLRSLLAQLLRDHGGEWPGRLQQLDGAQAASSLHRLRGTAGLLGARAVQSLAGEAETALRGGASMLEVGPLLGRLGQAMLALEGAARPWLSLAAEPGGQQQAATADDLARGATRCAELQTLLREQDLGAGAVLAGLRPWLRHQGLDGEALAQLQRWVDELEFPAAAQWLADRFPEPVA